MFFEQTILESEEELVVMVPVQERISEVLCLAVLIEGQKNEERTPKLVIYKTLR